MNDTLSRRLAGALLILTPVAFNLLFTLLSVNFEYPDILREPAGYVLERFEAGGTGLVAIWYGFMLTAVLFVPLVVLVHVVLAGVPFYLGLATAFGVIAGAVQFLGLVRWPFLVPYLAETYTDPASTGATRQAVSVVFEAFNRYAGAAVGEHLGYLFTGLWSALVAVAMLRSGMFGRFGRWLGLLGLISAAGILTGTLEFAGIAVAADVVTVAYILWSVWLFAFGIVLLRRGGPRTFGASREAGS